MQGKYMCVPVCVLILVAALSAKTPIERMSPLTVGVEYAFVRSEQAITEAEVNAVEQLNRFSAYYAPSSFFQVSLGLGGGNFEVEEYRNSGFQGGYGLSPSAGVYLSTPAFIYKRVRLLFDAEIHYLYSRDEEDFRYSGPVSDPALGLLLHLAPVASLEGGMRFHIMNGAMADAAENTEPFSNGDYRRIYFTLSTVSRVGVYFQVDFAASQAAVEEGFESGLKGTTLGFRLGWLITQDRKNTELSERNSVYFPDYEKMKERQDKMGEAVE